MIINKSDENSAQKTAEILKNGGITIIPTRISVNNTHRKTGHFRLFLIYLNTSRARTLILLW